jgi:hypothetical protein
MNAYQSIPLSARCQWWRLAWQRAALHCSCLHGTVKRQRRAAAATERGGRFILVPTAAPAPLSPLGLRWKSLQRVMAALPPSQQSQCLAAFKARRQKLELAMGW